MDRFTATYAVLPDIDDEEMDHLDDIYDAVFYRDVDGDVIVYGGDVTQVAEYYEAKTITDLIPEIDYFPDGAPGREAWEDIDL